MKFVTEKHISKCFTYSVLCLPYDKTITYSNSVWHALNCTFTGKCQCTKLFLNRAVIVVVSVYTFMSLLTTRGWNPLYGTPKSIKIKIWIIWLELIDKVPVYLSRVYLYLCRNIYTINVAIQKNWTQRKWNPIFMQCVINLPVNICTSTTCMRGRKIKCYVHVITWLWCFVTH